AFFEVATDSSRPLLVYTDRSVTEAPGTPFDLKAYPGDKRAAVPAAQWKAALRSTQAGDHPNGKEITKKQKGTLSREGALTVEEVPDLAVYLGWTEGRLVFINEPFDRVKITLERWYDIQIEIKSDNSGQLENRRFTG